MKKKTKTASPHHESTNSNQRRRRGAAGIFTAEARPQTVQIEASRAQRRDGGGAQPCSAARERAAGER